MRAIGTSISEAIDWMQDRLVTTRPLAERTLFALLAKRRITETAVGFVLIEDANEDDLKDTHKNLKNKRSPMKHRPRAIVMQKNVDLKQLDQLIKRLRNQTKTPTAAEQQRLDRLRETVETLHEETDAVS
jgi:prophage tail gpP-like protein